MMRTSHYLSRDFMFGLQDLCTTDVQVGKLLVHSDINDKIL